MILLVPSNLTDSIILCFLNRAMLHICVSSLSLFHCVFERLQNSALFPPPFSPPEKSYFTPGKKYYLKI